MKVGFIPVTVLCVAIMAMAQIFPHGAVLAGSTVSSSTTINGVTVRLFAKADGNDRRLSLPCADGTVRACQSACDDGICSVSAAWRDNDGRDQSAGTFSFPMGQAAQPDGSAHRWCLSVLDSMGAPLGHHETAPSSIRSTTKNGRPQINGFSCPTALEPTVFAP